jgi:dTDP-4-amino-4,6-dideoxygalactose transaminase
MTVGTSSPWPEFSADERAAVDVVLASGKVNYWTGEQGRSFEREYAASLGLRYGIALMNGTVALELPLKIWGFGAGDEVVVTPRSFIASTSCAVLQGCKPVFADVDRDSGNMTAGSIEAVLSPRTKAIILVHLGGWPCEIDEIMRLATARRIKVIEDCAQAHGAEYRGRPVGSIGHVGAFSFCQDKIITTGGEGGLLATDDEELWTRAWSFKDHGKSFETVFATHHPPGFKWLHESFGTNWRMTEMQAAIGRLQLRKLLTWSEKRRSNARALLEALRPVAGLRVPEPPQHLRHAYYRFYAYLEPERLRAGWTRERICAAIGELGVTCLVGSCPEIYREKVFNGTTYRPHVDLPVAAELGKTSLAFLVHPTLEVDDMERTADAVKTVLAEATR